jgi:hypothetical protein
MRLSALRGFSRVIYGVVANSYKDLGRFNVLFFGCSFYSSMAKAF